MTLSTCRLIYNSWCRCWSQLCRWICGVIEDVCSRMKCRRLWGYGKRKCCRISGPCLGYKQASQHGCYDGNGYRSLVQLKTPLIWYVFSYATKETNTHRSSLSTRHSSVTICILPTMVGRAEHTTVCILDQLEQFQKLFHCNGPPWHCTTHNKINDKHVPFGNPMHP